MTRVVVIGGGISGLAAAWELIRTPGTEVALVEGSSRLGGKIATSAFAGVDLDWAADAFLARVPAAVDLAREVGLGDDLVAPGTGQAWLWTRRGMRRLPPGLVLGVPTDMVELARSGVVPAAVVCRAAADLILPGRPLDPEEDVSVGELVRRRMGRGLQLGLVDALIGGINAGHTDHLSAAVAAPQLLAAARQDRSLIRGLRATATPAETQAGGPVFLTVRGGLQRLIDALARAIRAAPGAEVIVGDGAASLDRDGQAWSVRLASGRAVTADAVVVACPAEAAAGLVGRLSPGVAADLGRIDSASVALALLAYPEAARPGHLEGSGFLVPRTQRRLLTAASWVGTKWPHLATPGQIVIRASVGRVDDERFLALDDDELVKAVHSELASAMGLRTGPTQSRVHRWPRAFPQYQVGHLELVARAERRIGADAPGVVLAGAALRGVGIATCVRGAREAAVKARELTRVS